MIINISPLLKGTETEIPFSFTSDMEGITCDITAGQARAEGKVKNFSGYMLLEGTVEMKFSALCGRCGKSTEKNLTSALSRPVALSLTEEDDEYLLAEENGALDISEAVAEAIDAEMPVRFLCSEDCKGLCPKCGADLNITSCSCVVKNADPRLDKLRELLQSMENETEN